ncbi:MAG TPA: hypothetical protein VMX17_13480 [Candidatus Glassbacteria bacterium]|nr:hypothetical protein [Candidatus Glassbacteria bacterium]
MDAKILGVYANENQVGIKIGWCDSEHGFGEILITRNGIMFDIVIDSENMGKDFVKKVLNSLVDNGRIIS